MTNERDKVGNEKIQAKEEKRLKIMDNPSYQQVQLVYTNVTQWTPFDWLRHPCSQVDCN